jgi:hypothetical protein
MICLKKGPIRLSIQSFLVLDREILTPRAKGQKQKYIQQAGFPYGHPL